MLILKCNVVIFGCSHSAAQMIAVLPYNLWWCCKAAEWTRSQQGGLRIGGDIAYWFKLKTGRKLGNPGKFSSIVSVTVSCDAEIMPQHKLMFTWFVNVILELD